MAESQALIGYGRLLKIQDNSSPPQWVSVGEWTSVDGPNFAVDAPDVTHTESPGRFREFIAGLIDAGEVSGEINYVPGSSGLALMLARLGTKDRIRIEEPLAASPALLFECDAILTGFEITGPVDDKMSASVTFKLSGVPTMTGVDFETVTP